MFICLAPSVYADFQYRVETNNMVTITNYIGAGGNVAIPPIIDGHSVAAIGEYAFNCCANLTAITFPDSLTTIESWAFSECTSLTNITITEFVTEIGEAAFAWCTSLTGILVEESNPAYASINGILFNRDIDILLQYPIGKGGEYIIPYGVAHIENNSFLGCSYLTGITIPGSVITIGTSAFDYCNGLASINIDNGVTTIGERAFAWCTSLTSLTIPNSVNSLGASAFAQCTGLTNIELSDNITAIGERSFAWCVSLTAITIPNSVTNIGIFAFHNCTNLTSVTIGKNVRRIEGWVFYGCSRLTDVIIPDSVNTFGQWVFAECANLTSVYFTGNSPTNLGIGIFYNANQSRVYYCTNTDGWGATFAERPTSIWPQFLNAESRPVGFVFDIVASENQILVIEMCTDLSSGVWTPVSTNTIAEGSIEYTDVDWTNAPSRYYRVTLR